MSDHAQSSPATAAQAAPASAPAVPAVPDVPTWKLLTVLGGGGAFAGLIIVLAYQASQPRIQAHKAEVLKASVQEVLGAPEKWETLYRVGDSLTTKVPAGTDATKLERVYAGWRADGTRVGFAIVAAEPGFADDIKLIFGFDAEKQQILGFKVIENKETPGLGDAIEKKESFSKQFVGKTAPVIGIKKGVAPRKPANEIESITGATISSAAVVRIINHAVERWTPLLRAWHEEVPK